MTSAPYHIRILQGHGISYDFVHDKWHLGKKEVSEEYVLTFLIRSAKTEQKYRSEAGVYAQKWLYLAKHDPTICFAAFKKFRIRRNRNKRIAGKDLYAAFREDTDDPLSDDPEKRASELTTWCMHIKRFYDALSDGGYARCRSRARVAGKVLRSVFIGIELVDADLERIRKEADEIVANAVSEEPVVSAAPVSRMAAGFEHVPHPGDFAAMLLGKDRFDRSSW